MKGGTAKVYCSEKYDTIKDKNKGTMMYPCFGTDRDIFNQSQKIRKLQDGRNKLYRNKSDLKDIDNKIKLHLKDVSDRKNAFLDKQTDDKLKLHVIDGAPDLDIDIDKNKSGEAFNIAIFGSGKRGKSTLMVKIWERYFKDRKDLISILISPSSHIGIFKDMKNVIKINKFNVETTKIIKDIVKIQNKTENAYRFLLMIDDCINCKYNEMLNFVFLVARNHNVNAIVSLQYPRLLSIQARGSAQRIIAFSQNNYEATTNLLQSFFLSELRKLTGTKKIIDVAQEFMDLTQEADGHAFIVFNPFTRDLKRYALKI
jgi:hypothetical protein